MHSPRVSMMAAQLAHTLAIAEEECAKKLSAVL
jgi:hypothetical protein